MRVHVRGERDGSHVPHAGQQLHQPPIAERNTDDQTRRGQASRAHVDQAQDEGGQGEGAETQRRRVGDASVFDLLVETRLELSSKGGEALFASRRGVDVSEGTEAKAGGRFGGLVLFMCHFTLHACAVGLFAVGVPRVGGVGFHGHGVGGWERGSREYL